MYKHSDGMFRYQRKYFNGRKIPAYDMEVLWFLYKYPVPANVSQVACAIATSPYMELNAGSWSAASRRLKRLRRLGLVKDGYVGREHLFALTEAGEASLKAGRYLVDL